MIRQPAQISVLGTVMLPLGLGVGETLLSRGLPLLLKRWRLVHPCDGCLHCRLCFLIGVEKKGKERKAVWQCGDG